MKRTTGMSIYVGNLSIEVTEDELLQAFINFGDVTSVKTIGGENIGSSQSIGHGYVQMAWKSDGQAAIIGLQEKNLRGRLIQVVEALPLSNTSQTKPFLSKRGRYLDTKMRKR